MIRRLCAVLLVLACAFAPAVPVLEEAAKSDDSCGCGHSCCAPTDCAMPPLPARTTTLNVVGAFEVRTTVARPAARVVSVRPSSIFEVTSVSPRHAKISPGAIDAAASAPLYRAHCTFLL